MREADFATFTSLWLVVAGVVMAVGRVGVGRAQSQTADVQQLKSAALMAVITNQGGFGATKSWPGSRRPNQTEFSC
jgi:hypothetical protein